MTKIKQIYRIVVRLAIPFISWLFVRLFRPAIPFTLLISPCTSKYEWFKDSIKRGKYLRETFLKKNF